MANNSVFIHGESYPNGIMMNNDEKISIAIRKKDGSIGTAVRKRISLIKKHRILNVFILRGIIRFLEGAKNQFYAEDIIKEIESNGEQIKKKKSKATQLVILMLIMGVILYFLVPTLIAFFSKGFFQSQLILSGFESLLRLTIFLTFFVVFSLLERSNNTVKYHGAEHKTLWNIRKKQPLTVENSKKYPIQHPSCGTSVLLLMIIISIPIFYFINYDNLIFRIAIILLLLPLLIGISFEIITWLDKSESIIVKIVAAPGLLLQRVNTKEPDEKQLEIALYAIKNLLNP